MRVSASFPIISESVLTSLERAATLRVRDDFPGIAQGTKSLALAHFAYLLVTSAVGAKAKNKFEAGDAVVVFPVGVPTLSEV